MMSIRTTVTFDDDILKLLKLKALEGSVKYRLRVGNDRVLYKIEDDKLLFFVVKVAHRKSVCD